jgi:hypothetical protein
VFCAVSAWSRWQFVRFDADGKSATTFAMLGEHFAEQQQGVAAALTSRREGHRQVPPIRRDSASFRHLNLTPTGFPIIECLTSCEVI